VLKVSSLVAAAVLLPAVAGPADAYVGPGAGFALVTSFFVLLTTFLGALVSLALWPARRVWRRLRYGPRPTPLVRRLIVIGFDGQEPSLTERWMREGKLPNFVRLAEMGCYHRLRTTCPAISPVAWASFSTGTNPARHNIFDFVHRDPRTYLPTLSSSRITAPDRSLAIGRYRLPLGRPRFELLRRSKPFWQLLGERHVWSTILRVPITFPPDRFYGAELSAMATPDLLGTQGAFWYFSTHERGIRSTPGGTRIGIVFDGETAETEVLGPGNAFRAGSPPLRLPLRISIDPVARRARVRISGQTIELTPGVLSPWVRLTFRAAPLVNVFGICRILLTELGEHVSLYVTPIGLDPDRPAMPISHPRFYATYLAKRIGRFATLGLAEDTGALNEGVIEPRAFLDLTNDIDDERQRMCLAGLDRLREGLLVCVFDATDRVQHMCWRELEASLAAGEAEEERATAIEQLYRRNDVLLGRLLDLIRRDDVLMVISDHGFSAFRRGVNVNRWLLDRGLLTLRSGADGSSEWLRDVDWSRTRAYAMGLTGVFVNVRGREAQGIVAPEDVAALKAVIAEGLRELIDPGNGARAISDVFDTRVIYDGPYLANAPDLVVGYSEGYRVSWSTATGRVAGEVLEDNARPWSGDHAIDSRLVPGVFFCSRRVDTSDPSLIDIAPTALHLFGLPVPSHMEGRPLLSADARAGSRDARRPDA
jgi:predicted AlkP superfamily phosphohydrolase/phosphomutase